MKQPYWKRLLSYFTDVRIEETESSFNEYLFIVLRNDRYQLCTSNAIYSYEDKYSNFGNAFKETELPKVEIIDVLVLGMGLGSIPYLLEKQNPNQKFHFTCVELDPEVIALAERYTLYKIKSPMDILQTDAFSFVDITAQKFDVVCVDLFLDDQIPEIFEQIEFLEQLERLSNDKATLFYNRLSLSEEEKRLSTLFFKEKFQNVFPQSTILDVGTNFMLINK